MIDDGFLHWFAGFADGEGCFMIDVSPTENCWFQMWLRDDDARVLEELQRRLDMGRLYRDGSTWEPSGNRQPRIAWYVKRKADCARLVVILDSHPLRAKKARDFAIWRRAVQVIQQPTSPLWTARLTQLRAELQAVRRYETAGEIPMDTLLASDDQLALDMEAA